MLKLMMILLLAFLLIFQSIDCSAATVTSNGFELEIAAMSVWLSSYAYCPTEAIADLQFEGPLKNFTALDTFYHPLTDSRGNTITHIRLPLIRLSKRLSRTGFYGYEAKTKTIWVVYRGTTETSILR